MQQSLTDRLNGQTRFHRLQLIEEAAPIVKYGPAKNRPNDRIYRERTARCRCDCGAEVVVRVSMLKSGNTKSCGCLHRETIPSYRTHGGRHTPEYSAWHALKARSLNPKDKDFNLIGGAGVAVCARWKDSFENFLADMGPRPSDKHVLVRYPDPHGNFEPGNCMWSTHIVRARHRRNAIQVVYDGESMPLREACARVGIHPHVVSKRKCAGWHQSRWFEPVKGTERRRKA